MEQIDLFLVVLGGLVLILTPFTRPLQSSLFSEPMLSFFIGLVLRFAAYAFPGYASLTYDQRSIVEESARLALAIGLMGSALRIPTVSYSHIGWSVAALLAIVMPIMGIVSGLLVYGIVGLPFWVSMLVGAALAPTDPVLATTVVSGEIARQNVPGRIRDTLTVESGLNDGLAYPLVLLPILLLTEPLSMLPFDWFVIVILGQVVGAAVFGAALGYASGRLLLWAERAHEVPRIQIFPYTVALALLTLGGARLLGTDGVLAVFISGVFFSAAYRQGSKVLREESEGVVARFFFATAFLFLGLTVPWDGWIALGWRGLAVVMGVLLLRRLPAVLALSPLIRSVRGLEDRLFVGWFGPMGVSAAFYVALGGQYVGFEQIWPVSSLVIAASTVAFGITAAPFTRLYGKHVRRHRRNR